MKKSLQNISQIKKIKRPAIHLRGRAPESSCRFDKNEIAALPTLCIGQCCDLKIETPRHRVWLCRVGGGITIEVIRNGRWEIASGNCQENSQ